MLAHFAVVVAVVSSWAATQPVSAHATARPHWPRHIATDYQMFSRGGNRAVRHVVWRASRLLRAGASRRRVMSRVSTWYQAVEVDKRYEEASDTAVCDAFADELDPWLVAAGYERIDAFDEFAF